MRDTVAANVEIRALANRSEFTAAVDLQQQIWGPAFGDLVPPSILKVTQRIGGIAAGAFDADGELLGFVFGLTGVEGGRLVHWSDMLAVRPEARNLGIGRRLKLFQRDVVRPLGVELIYWTFDPMIARNAHLNFNRFGVYAADYVEDMYGATGSAVHGNVPTDRLVVAWPTRDIDVDVRLAESRRALESADCRHAPIATEAWIASVEGATILPHCVRVELPVGGESVMTGAEGGAGQWRQSVRHGLQWGLRAGYDVCALLRDDSQRRAYYLLTRPVRGA